MSEQDIAAQAAGKRRRWPVVVMVVVGLVVYLGTVVASLRIEPAWVDASGLSWDWVSLLQVAGMFAGLVLMLCGWNVWHRPVDDKPDPLAGIERELADLRREVAALRVRLGY